MVLVVYSAHKSRCGEFIVQTSDDMICPGCGDSFIMEGQSNAIRVLASPWSLQVLPCNSILVKPSRGTFSSFQMGDDLHIGISNSFGRVFSFWTDGVVEENDSWLNSVVVYEFLDETFGSEFEPFLRVCKGQFVKEKYHHTSWNCFDFVLAFLARCNVHVTKDVFVESYIREPLKRVLKYVALEKRIQNEDFIRLS